MFLIYFRATFMEILLNLFIWFWFLYFFNIFFILLNSYAVKCLDHTYERAYYFYITLFGAFHECFACVLQSFEYHFNSLLLTSITGVCFEISCSIVSRFAEASYLNFTAVQLTGCHMMQELCVATLGTDY